MGSSPRRWRGGAGRGGGDQQSGWHLGSTDRHWPRRLVCSSPDLIPTLISTRRIGVLINFSERSDGRTRRFYGEDGEETEGLFKQSSPAACKCPRNMSQGLGPRGGAISGRELPLRNLADPLDPTAPMLRYPTATPLMSITVPTSLRASVSVNTDFAEVESDQRRVNLTRFIRLPERRDFFPEGSGVFSFASQKWPNPRSSLPTHRVNPRPTTQSWNPPHRAGGSIRSVLSNRHSKTGLLALLIEQDVTAPVVFTVARIRRKLWEQSAIGGIYTLRRNRSRRRKPSTGSTSTQQASTSTWNPKTFGNKKPRT